MTSFRRALPAFRTVWKATGWWGPAWAIWTLTGLLVQAAVLATRPADTELRRNVNMVFALGTLVLLFQVMTRIRDWQDAHTPAPAPAETAEAAPDATSEVQAKRD